METESMPNKRQLQRGSAILELGLILPVAMLLVCGVMDFARVFYAGIVVESAARAGVQFGSYSMGKADLDAMNSAGDADAAGQGLTGVVVTSRTFCGCTASTGEVSCSTATCSGATPSGYVETTATYTFSPLIPYPGMPGNIAVASTARIRVQ